MERRLSTDTVGRTDRLTYWQDMICDVFVQLDASAPESSSFRGHLHQRTLSGTGLIEVKADAQQVYRSSQQIRKADEAYFLVGLQTSGTNLITQDGRTAFLKAGDFAVYDTTRPYTLSFDDAFSQVIFQISRERLDARLVRPDVVTAQSIRGGSGFGHVASTLMGNLWQHFDQLSAQAHETLETTLIDLISGCLNEQAGQDAASVPAMRLARIKHFISGRLGDPALDVSMVAAATHLSVRTVQYLFAEQGLTISRFLREARLERCRRQLSDPLHRHRSITEIALGLGFNNLSHFSQVFRERYGCSPAEVRPPQAQAGRSI